jgi:transposase-like protein
MTSDSPFKWRHFEGQIILLCVRWYCKYGISYRDLEEMMADLEWDELEKALESIRHESHPTPPLSL